MEEKNKIQKLTPTLVIYPHLKGEISLRSPESRLEEAANLTEALDLKVVQKNIVNIKEITPATYLGKGKVKELAEEISEKEIMLVVMDCRLTPIQQRNLEKELKAKVIDRTALIIEIFGSRARTREGKLQVELASLEYQKSRLVRTWTHLERQRGGFGFLAGPGETQIEVDRRLLGGRITKIKRELELVKRTRLLHRKSRKSVPYPIVALVGYTNAGKSTLFNKLTKAKVIAEDMLFATLDPTMRVLHLPSKRKIILSDTVGFISSLPTELVAAFRATLEEVIEADLVLHVRDISADETEAEKHDVLEVMASLGIENKPVIEVMNKTDLLVPHPNLLPRVEGKNPSSLGRGRGEDRTIHISALTGLGIDNLLKLIDKKLEHKSVRKTVKIPIAEGKLIAWIYENAEDVKSEIAGETMKLSMKISEKNLKRLEKIIKANG